MAHRIRVHKGKRSFNPVNWDETTEADNQAALQSMSDVMRRELVAVGIDVITLELGKSQV